MGAIDARNGADLAGICKWHPSETVQARPARLSEDTAGQLCEVGRRTAAGRWARAQTKVSRWRNPVTGVEADKEEQQHKAVQHSRAHSGSSSGLSVAQ